MTFDFAKNKENENLIPYEISNKQQYYFDLLNIEHSFTGRLDAQIANTFILESSQLVINSIALFEQGYFDCSYYSLRQSLEVSTTMIYLVDIDDELREIELKKWKDQSRFPMYNQMIKMLENDKSIFSEIKDIMRDYFEDLKLIKQKLNKFIHKQGFNTFYVSRNHPFFKNKTKDTIVMEFEELLIKCIGAIAVFRLAIDPFPILLNDEEIYNRTGDLLTDGYSNDFIDKYIGSDNIKLFKKTTMYLDYYESIMSEEAKQPCVANVVKKHYIDKSQIENILKQSHLMYKHDIIAVFLCSVSPKIAKIYCMGGFHFYFTNVDTNRKKMSWKGEDFKKFEESKQNYNLVYDEAFISYLKFGTDGYFIEHNDKFTAKEIKKLENMKKEYTDMNKELPYEGNTTFAR